MEDWFSEGLIRWYKRNKRDLPWRNERDPYKIWLSEIILQQTQVKQGLSYYLKFVEHFPTVQLLARASEDQVLKLWQGLGYYSRARNLHEAAIHVVKEHKGLFPSDYNKIRALKGVGEYTAAAIASFAFDQAYAVVDGNVYRVLSRLFGLETPIDSSKGKKLFRELARDLLYTKSPGIYNQAIMEFGALYCKPANPECGSCIFAAKCLALKHKSVADLPKKSKKVAIRDRYLNYLVIADVNGRVLVKKRDGKDIWKGLYEFVLLETKKKSTTTEVLAGAVRAGLTGKSDKLFHTSVEYRHQLTHQRLHAKFYVLKTKREHQKDQKTVQYSQLNKLALARLTERFLSDCDLKEII